MDTLTAKSLPIPLIRRALLKALDGLIILALLFLLFIAYGSLPNRWYQVLAVTSGSMAPTFQPGDLIVISRPPEQVKPGMVLTLWVNGSLVTHRLIGLTADGELLTKGDANSTPDDWTGDDVQVKGLYRAHIPLLGYLMNVRSLFKGMTSTSSWYIDANSVAIGLGVGEWFTSSSTPSLTPVPTLTLTPTITKENDQGEGEDDQGEDRDGQRGGEGLLTEMTNTPPSTVTLSPTPQFSVTPAPTMIFSTTEAVIESPTLTEATETPYTGATSEPDVAETPTEEPTSTTKPPSVEEPTATGEPSSTPTATLAPSATPTGIPTATVVLEEP